jgi:hypothetical protein
VSKLLTGTFIVSQTAPPPFFLHSATIVLSKGP